MCDYENHFTEDGDGINCICDAENNYKLDEENDRCVCNDENLIGCLECEEKPECTKCDTDAGFILD